MGENIGAAARAMHNFGLSDLRIVAPRDGWPNQMAIDVARNALEIVNNARVYDSLKDAVSDVNVLYVTTARPRDIVKPVVTPEVCAVSMHRLTHNGKKCAVMFGPERSGVSNEDLVLADSIITIPVSPDNPSLNLAQAVLVICYEWFSKNNTDKERPVDECVELATKDEIALMVTHLEEELEAKGFFKLDHMKRKMHHNLANIFTRNNLTSQEVRTLRGVIRSLSSK